VNLLAQPRHAKGGNIVPAQWRSDIQDVLITEEQLSRRVGELARAITRDYVGKDLLVIALLTGTVMFLADLLRHLILPLRLDFMGVSSYSDTTAAPKPRFLRELRLEVKDRDVLLVDDILDTGRTITAADARIRGLGPRSLKTCVLLDKPARRAESILVDYVGFVIPDLFVVGYGLDYAERYRNLPFVGVLHPELYHS